MNIDINQLLKDLEKQVLEVALKECKDFAIPVAKDFAVFLAEQTSDLARYAGQFASGALTSEEMGLLVDQKAKLLQMRQLQATVASAVEIQRIKGIVLGAVKTVLGGAVKSVTA